MSVKFGVIGDGHLDKNRILDVVGTVANEVMLDHMEGVIKSMVAQGITDIIWLGDVADKSTLSDEAELLLMKKVHKWTKKVTLHIIPGNHDLEQENVHSLCKLEWLAKSGLIPNLYIYTEYTKKKIQGLTFEFLPYPLKESKSKKPTICIGHFGVSGAIGDNGSRLRGGHEHKAKDNSVYILGHLHTTQKVGKSYYPGTLYQTSFGEPMPKGYSIFEINKNYEVVGDWWKELEPPFKFINLEVFEQDDLVIPDNPMHKVKVFYASDKVDIPSNLMLKYSNIVELIPFKNKIELAEQKDLIQRPETIDYDIKSNLPDFLSGRKLTKKQIKRANKLVDKALADIYKLGD